MICPFVLGEIVVFDSVFRREVFIAEIRQIHIDYWGTGINPDISKATIEQKKQWFDNDSFELVIVGESNFINAFNSIKP